MSLARIPILLSIGWTNHITLTPPNRTQETDQTIATDWGEVLFQRTMNMVPPIVKNIASIATLCDVAVTIARRFPSHPLASKILEFLVREGPSSLARMRVTRLLLLGWSLTMVGSAIRIASYREMGRLFTYEITIRKGHHLITSGPYGVVRHPAYISGTLAWTGLALCHFGRGSWVRESGVLGTRAGAVLGGAWVAGTLFFLVNFAARTWKEDALLKERFGEEWEEWAKRVPYKVLPGIW